MRKASVLFALLLLSLLTLVVVEFSPIKAQNSALVAPTVTPLKAEVGSGCSLILSSSVVTTGASPYTYQWFSEHVPGASSYTLISGANSSSYHFSWTTDTFGEWSFIIQVTDSTCAAVNSTAATVILASSGLGVAFSSYNNKVYVDESVQITAVYLPGSPANGMPPYTYQWNLQFIPQNVVDSPSFPIPALFDIPNYDPPDSNSPTLNFAVGTIPGDYNIQLNIIDAYGVNVYDGSAPGFIVVLPISTTYPQPTTTSTTSRNPTSSTPSTLLPTPGSTANTASPAVGVTATIMLGGSPSGVAYDSGKGEIFVTNSGNDTISVISDSTNEVIATIPTEVNPGAVAYDPATGEIFVANYGYMFNPGSGSVSVISDNSNTIVANVPLATSPKSVAYDPGKGEIFVANYYGSTSNYGLGFCLRFIGQH